MLRGLVFFSLFSSVIAKTTYRFDCGEYGAGKIEIKDEEMGFKCNLRGVDQLTSQSELAYHLHTIWTNMEDFSTSTCGSAYTGLHYDPTLQCGPASEARGLGVCDTPYICDSFETCEVGDLSGKWGKLVINSNGIVNANESGDTSPVYPADFVEDNTEKDEGLFSSIVFHEGIGGARVLCCKLTLDD